MKRLMIWLIGIYRKYISPLKPPCCRFTPSCSAYAIEAFEKRGFFVGFILTVWRILRCNPFSKGGYDPVPEKGFRNKKPGVKDTSDAKAEPTCCEKEASQNNCGNPQKKDGSIKNTPSGSI